MNKSRLRLSPQSSVLVSLLLLCFVSLASGQDLRVFQTTHYRVHTDLDDDLAGDLGHRMDVMYDEYARRMAGFHRPDETMPLEVYLVHSREKYLHLVGITMAGTAGAFNPQRKLLASFLDGQGRDSLRRTLQHEAFHQFAAEAIGPNLPIWLNEGLAQVFEEGVWINGAFRLGEVPPRRLRQLHHDIQSGALFDFGDVLAMNPLQWAMHRRDPIEATVEYNQAWAMTHFLIFATDANGQPKYRDRLIQMLKLVHDGDDGQSAFTFAFSDDIPGFAQRFNEFAASLQPTPLATLIENQSVLGDFLIQLKQRGRTFDSLGEFRDTLVAGRWSMHYRSNNLQWQSADDPGVYFESSTGQPFDSDEEYFELAGDRPLADLVCHAAGMPPLRTRFSNNDGNVEHETFVDSE
jgi:hypothetical protein